MTGFTPETSAPADARDGVAPSGARDDAPPSGVRDGAPPVAGRDRPPPLLWPGEGVPAGSPKDPAPVAPAAPAPAAATVRVRNLTRRFDAHPAVFNISFDLAAGDSLALLGPKGCGKTTLLRCLAGLDTPDAGTIDLNGQPVFDAERGTEVPPERRDLGFAVQTHAVWPHMTVAENIAFPLKMRGMAPASARQRVLAMLDLVRLRGFEDRSAALLTPAQRQRVGLARALVHEPKLVLFDEAFGELDTAGRAELRLDLRESQARLGFAAIFAESDPDAAFAMAETAVLMNSGGIETIGTARSMVRRPPSAFAARFFGMNVLEGRVVKEVPGGPYLEVELGERLVVRGLAAPDLELPDGGRVLACIRPDAVRLLRPARPEAAVGRVAAVSFRTGLEEYFVDVADVRLRAFGLWGGFEKGDPVDVTMTPDDWVFVR